MYIVFFCHLWKFVRCSWVGRYFVLADVIRSVIRPPGLYLYVLPDELHYGFTSPGRISTRTHFVRTPALLQSKQVVILSFGLPLTVYTDYSYSLPTTVTLRPNALSNSWHSFTTHRDDISQQASTTELLNVFSLSYQNTLQVTPNSTD